jgi:hypothetical protein
VALLHRRLIWTPLLDIVEGVVAAIIIHPTSEPDWRNGYPRNGPDAALEQVTHLSDWMGVACFLLRVLIRVSQR